MIWFCLAFGVVLAVLARHRKRVKTKNMVFGPLAGYDTGVRSPWRTPGRFVKPHRGF